MESSVEILIGTLAAILNLVFCFLLLYTEMGQEATDKIPPREKILYLEDYNLFKWGYRWFLSVMDFAIAFVLVERWPLPVLAILLCPLVGIAWTALWHHIFMGESHRPDSIYPYTGAVSFVGRIHIIYFGAQYIFGSMGLWMVFLMLFGQRMWSPIAFIGLAAVVGHFIMVGLDHRAGRFTRPRNPPG